MIPTGTPTCTNPYTVKDNEFCYTIASQYGLSVAQILSQNPTLDAYCDITSGQVICLPPTATTTVSSTPTGIVNCAQTYIVQEKDYCYLIADKFHISYEDLRSLNPQLDSDCNILVGDTLCVKSSATSTSTTVSQTETTTTSSTASETGSTTTSSSQKPTSTSGATCLVQYTVKEHDYCYAIATAFSITVPELQSYNPQLDSNCLIHPGEVLCVAMGNQITTTMPPTGTPLPVNSTMPFSNTTSFSTSTTKHLGNNVAKRVRPTNLGLHNRMLHHV